MIALITFSCNSESPELIERDGLMYLENSSESFTGSWQNIDKNGILLSEINYLNGAKNGKYTINDTSGNLWYEGYIKNGFEDSLWTEWHSNGEIKEQGMFKEGIKHACWKKWDNTGKLYDERFYRTYIQKYASGNLHYKIHDYVYKNPDHWWLIDNCEIYYENGNNKISRTEKFIDYKNRTTENRGKLWHENSQITESYGKKTIGDTLPYWKPTTNKEYFYAKGWSADGNITRDDSVTKVNDITYKYYNWFYDSGMKRFSGKSTNNKRQDQWIWLNEKGDTTAIALYKNDTMLNPKTMKPFNGVFKAGSPEDDGAIVNATYVNGIKNGIAEHYWKNEINSDYHLSGTGSYKNGLKEGLWTYYNSDRIKNLEWSYKEGNRDGKSTVFYESGKTHRIMYYKNDKLNGEWTSYREDGSLMYKGNYKDGLEIGESHYYYSNGNDWGINTMISKNEQHCVTLHNNATTYETGNRVDSRKNGLWQRWYDNGNPIDERSYLNGNLHGESSIYHKNGNINLTFNAWNNILSGPFILYTEKGNKKIEGNWLNGVRSGQWTSYNADGSIIKMVEYDQGESIDGDTISLTFDFSSLFEN